MSTNKVITYTGLLNDIYYRANEIDNEEVLQLLRQTEAIPKSQLTFKGHIFVMDYTQGRHVALSGQTKEMIGYDARDVMDGGVDFVINRFQNDDFAIYNEKIFSRVVAFLKNTVHAQHSEHLFSFSYRVKNAEGKWAHLFQQGNYITNPKTNLPVYSMGITLDISPLKKDNSMIFSIDKREKEGSAVIYKNILTEYYYPDPEESLLSRREREILGRLADGLSSKQVADKLNLSENTIVNHRKNMLKKTNTKNIAELIRYATGKGII
jgi:DNA-binding CsgD family transcriptional regulator